MIASGAASAGTGIEAMAGPRLGAAGGGGSEGDDEDGDNNDGEDVSMGEESTTRLVIGK